MSSVSHLPFVTRFINTLNAWPGYLPMGEWEYGGYEVETISPFTPSAAKDVRKPFLVILKPEMRTC